MWCETVGCERPSGTTRSQIQTGSSLVARTFTMRTRAGSLNARNTSAVASASAWLRIGAVSGAQQATASASLTGHRPFCHDPLDHAGSQGFRLGETGIPHPPATTAKRSSTPAGHESQSSQRALSNRGSSMYRGTSMRRQVLIGPNGFESSSRLHRTIEREMGDARPHSIEFGPRRIAVAVTARQAAQQPPRRLPYVWNYTTGAAERLPVPVFGMSPERRASASRMS